MSPTAGRAAWTAHIEEPMAPHMWNPRPTTPVHPDAPAPEATSAAPAAPGSADRSAALLSGQADILVHRRGLDGGPAVTTSGPWWNRHRIVWVRGAQGVVVGNGNCQRNSTRLRVTGAHVRLDGPALGLATMRMFIALADNPASAGRQAALRRQLLADNHRQGGAVRPAPAPAGPVRVADATVVVTRSAGVVVGDRNTQVNRFRYRWQNPAIRFQELVAESPALVRMTAALMARPDDGRRMSALLDGIDRALSAAAPALYRDSPDGMAAGFDRTAGVMVGGPENHQHDRSTIDIHRLDANAFIAFVCTEAQERIDTRDLETLAELHRRNLDDLRTPLPGSGATTPDRCVEVGRRLRADLAAARRIQDGRLARLRPDDPTHAVRRVTIEADIRRLDAMRSAVAREILAARTAAEDDRDRRRIDDLCERGLRRLAGLAGVPQLGGPAAGETRHRAVIARVRTDLDRCATLQKGRLARLDQLDPHERLGWLGPATADRAAEVSHELEVLDASRALAAGTVSPGARAPGEELDSTPVSAIDRMAAALVDVSRPPAPLSIELPDLGLEVITVETPADLADDRPFLLSVADADAGVDLVDMATRVEVAGLVDVLDLAGRSVGAPLDDPLDLFDYPPSPSSIHRWDPAVNTPGGPSSFGLGGPGM